MSQSSPSGKDAGGGTVRNKALSANAASFYPSSSSSTQQQNSQSFTGSAPSPGAAGAPAPAAGASTTSTRVASVTGASASPSSPSATSQQQRQSQSSSAASPSSRHQQHQSAWGGLRVRTYSAGTMGTATSVGDTSAAIDHFSEYLYDYEDYEVSSQEVRVAMDQQSQEGMHQQYQQGQHNQSYYDDQINSDIEAEMDRDQEMADMEGLVVAMNETSGVRAGGSENGGGGGGGIGSSAHEYWFPECRDCGCCRGYKFGCVCVQGGVSTMCKCTSVLESATNGTASTNADDKRLSVESSAASKQRGDGDAEMDLDAT